jgi:hypothetical protein
MSDANVPGCSCAATGILFLQDNNMLYTMAARH